MSRTNERNAPRLDPVITHVSRADPPAPPRYDSDVAEGAFDDAEDLDPEVRDADLAATVASLARADLAGADPGAVTRAFDAAPARGQARMAAAWGDAMARDGLGDWIDADAGRRARADQIALHLTPPDPAAPTNDAALAAIRAYDAWDRHAYPLIIVPGYTPRDLAAPSPEIHPVAARRVAQAAEDFAAGLAPFVLLSGGAVYPRGTPYAEAMIMRDALLARGVPEERILCDARARHSTTNLRNAGRFMLAAGMARAVITTMGGGIAGSDVFGQDFYFASPGLSTFHLRCRRELGYRVGELTSAGEHHIAFTPSPEVTTVGFRDALDP